MSAKRFEQPRETPDPEHRRWLPEWFDFFIKAPVILPGQPLVDVLYPPREIKQQFENEKIDSKG